ncbi:hypothetical protein RRG08_008648 [Elysia crispata]|uniref:Uncharacterized protein n=1 Tax=Elysia crispata TaxID=231223 RepID=A0AAE0XZZ5_9GAST|nr:hypothetical protein RRG08_008648 [Elysia crispata]
MTESDPGSALDLDTLSLDGHYGLQGKSASENYLPGARRKKRQAKLDRPASTEGSQAIMSSADAAASDGDTLSNGDTPIKSGRSRIRLWDSFLSKTRKIRIRKSRDSSKTTAGEASKLQARASSQPNIPISADKESFRSRPMSASSPDEANKTFPRGPSSDRWRDYGIVDDEDDVDKSLRRRDEDGNEEDDEDEESHANNHGSSTNSRRAVYRRAPQITEKSRTRSSSSNDDLYDSAQDRSPTDPPVSRPRVGRRFFHRQTPDDGYRSSQDHNFNNSGNVDKVSRLPPSGNRRPRSTDLHNSIGSTPRREDVTAEPRALSREDLYREGSPAHSEDGEKSSKEVVVKDDHRKEEDEGEAELEQEEDGVPVIEQTSLETSPSYRMSTLFEDNQFIDSIPFSLSPWNQELQDDAPNPTLPQIKKKKPKEDVDKTG